MDEPERYELWWQAKRRLDTLEHPVPLSWVVAYLDNLARGSDTNSVHSDTNSVDSDTNSVDAISDIEAQVACGEHNVEGVHDVVDIPSPEDYERFEASKAYQMTLPVTLQRVNDQSLMAPDQLLPEESPLFTMVFPKYDELRSLQVETARIAGLEMSPPLWYEMYYSCTSKTARSRGRRTSK
jgi:hypothetical protein